MEEADIFIGDAGGVVGDWIKTSKRGDLGDRQKARTIVSCIKSNQRWMAINLYK